MALVVKVHARVLNRFSPVPFFETLWTVVHQAPLPMGIAQARILEWVAMSSTRGSSRPRDQTHVSWGSCIAGGFFTPEPLGKPSGKSTLLLMQET